MYHTRIPAFIEGQIYKIARKIRDKFTVLIISPYRRQSKAITQSLKDKGIINIQFTERTDDNELTILDGLKLLMQRNNSECNLGWRIVSKFILQSEDFISLLKKTEQNNQKIIEVIDSQIKKDVKHMLKVLRAIRDNREIAEISSEIFERVNYEPITLATAILKDEIKRETRRCYYRFINKIPITATTIQSSKGLDADYVFITHFDDQFLIRSQNKISDQDVCNFIVPLTRAKKKVYLISIMENKTPTFLQWINQDRIEYMKIQ